MRKKILFIISIALFQSCALINTPGFNSGYNRLSAEEKSNILFLNPDEEVPCLNDGRIVAVTSSHMSDLLRKKGNVLLYLWSPHCSSDVCVSLKTIQDFCNKANLNLYVLTEYYTDAFLHNSCLSNPLLSINEVHYKTHYCNLYLKKFMSELLPKHKVRETLVNRIFLFSNGEFVQSYEKIDNVMKNNSKFLR